MSSNAPTLPVDVVNRALDECGVEEIGDLLEGTKPARAAARIYWPTLRQVLSAAHWNFARRTEVLNLLGSTGAPSTAVPPLPVATVGNPVPPPWTFMYEWPPDCVHARYIPQTNPNGVVVWNSPARFIVASYPLPNDGAQWFEVEGHDPDQTRVILTNVNGASLVYTGLMQYPDAWDPLFEQAMVSALAARLAMTVIDDKKEAAAVRRENRVMAVEALNAARVRDGNEGWTVVDHTPDWIRARTVGAAWYGPGIWWYGWTPMPWTEDAGGVY